MRNMLAQGISKLHPEETQVKGLVQVNAIHSCKIGHVK